MYDIGKLNVVLNRRLLQILPNDPYYQKILAVLNSPKSIPEISKICNIPISTTYRRITMLSNLDLLKISGDIIDGAKLRKYKRKIVYPLSTKILRKNILLSFISENPGINYTKLKKLTGYPNGTLSPYLANLENDGKLFVKRSKMRTWYFMPNIDPVEMVHIIFLRKETPKRILEFLFKNGPSYFTAIKLQIQKSPSTVSLYLTRLVESGIVRRIPGFRPTYELTNKELVYKTIKIVEPSLLDKFKDRFADTFSYL